MVDLTKLTDEELLALHNTESEQAPRVDTQDLSTLSDEDLLALNQIQEEPAPTTDLVSDIKSELGGAGAGLATGYAVKKGQDVVGKAIAPTINKAATGALNLIGELPSEDINKIKNSPELYRKTRQMPDIATELGDMTQEIREQGISSAGAADAIVAEKGIKAPKKQLLRDLGTALEGHTFDVETGFQSNIPVEILEESPQLANKSIPPSMEKSIKDEVSFLTKVKEPQGKQLTNYLDSISDKASFNKNQNVSDLENVLRDYREGVRSNIASQSPEFATLKTAAKEGMDEQKALQRILGVKRGELSGEYEARQTTPKKLTNLLGKSDELGKADLNTLTSILNKYDKNELLQEADLARIKDLVAKRGVNIKGTSLSKAGVMGSAVEYLSNIPGIGKAVAVGSLLKQGIGTKAQELGALLPSSAVGKVAKGAGKVAKGLLPLAGGLAAYAAATSEGASAGEALGLAAEEELLGPLAPTTTGPRRNTLEHKLESGEQLTAEEHIALNKQTQPTKTTTKDNLETLDSVVQASPEKIVQFSDAIAQDESLKSFVGPLQKAAEAPERTRKAILFGLYQQPAFREVLKRVEGKKDE